MRLPTIIACLFTIVTTAATSAQPSPEQAASPTGLTADQVAEAAVVRSPDLAARRADVRAAAAGVRHALDAYIPHVKLAARYVRLSRIDAPSRVAHVVAAARHSEHATRLLEAAEHRRVAADARIAYYTWARARLEAEVAADAVHQADLHLADVQHRLDADQFRTAWSVGATLTWTIGETPRQLAAATQLRDRAIPCAVSCGPG